jgi:hypothetical protein
MNQITTHRETELTPERIDRGLEWLKRSLWSLNDCHETRRKAEAAVMALSEPAHPAKVMARVLALLNPYFDKDTPQAIREIEAEDWAVALGEYPYWAIEKAARWWKSEDNADRRKRPLEGDIARRCRMEMDAINAARVKLQSPTHELRRSAPEPYVDPRSDEEREQMRKKIDDVARTTLASMRSRLAGEEKAF